MEFNEIIKLINTVSTSNLDSFVLEHDSFKLKLKNKADYGSDVTISSNCSDSDSYNDYKIVESPLVGVFYSHNTETGEPFISPGDIVKEGQVVGIIEAMKLMNEVISTVSGVVEEILIQDETTVEYGQPLIKISVQGE